MTIKNVTEGKKKFKSLIGFLSANKIDNYKWGVGGWEGGKNPKNKSKNKNNKCFS